MTYPSWITCQIGAREHYAIPRSLHLSHQLKACLTDTWVPPNSLLRRLQKSGLNDRFHPDLQEAPIHAFSYSTAVFEVRQRLQSTPPWTRMMARNQWFQAQVIKKLKTLRIDPTQPPILFSYSYAALDLFRYAHRQGWKTVLGQIDPGLAEDQIVQAVAQRYPHLALPTSSPPAEYWQQWYQECELADRIVVNSPWSAQLLQQSGIPEKKLAIIPLVYEPDSQSVNYQRVYPTQFTSDRPLRILFLGQINLRKGIGEIFEAIDLLEGYSIEFWFVGSIQVKIPTHFQDHPQVRWLGQVPRSQAFIYYQQADVFLLPTHSDGFALTQLEAQAWRLPLIVSPYCGKVVKPGITGLQLGSVTASAIAEALQYAVGHPNILQCWSQAIQSSDGEWTLSGLANQLVELKNLHGL